VTIGGYDPETWERMFNGAVPDSYRARRALMLEMHKRFQCTNVNESAKHGIDLSWSVRGGRPAEWNDADREREFLEYQFAWNWALCGSVEYRLTHSIAALLSVTKAPPLDPSRLPFNSFLIQVPEDFFPIPSSRGSQTRWIGIQKTKAAGDNGRDTPVDCTVVMFVADSDMLADFCFLPSGVLLSEDDKLMAKWDSTVKYGGLSKIGIRLAANVVSYITEHRESVVPVSLRAGCSSFEVRPPKDVIVDRSFRDSASHLVRSRDFAGAKRSLAHIVRGHWRNQPVGEGRAERRLTWVRPHKRGDESLGRVVQRIERIK
jgi:hypothetical protein